MIPFKTNRYLQYLIIIFFLSALFGLVGETTTFISIALSSILILPMLFLLFSNPQKNNAIHWTNSFTRPFIVVLIIIDILGFLFLLTYGGDEFGMAYGRHYEYVHGLSMVNTYVLLWYMIKLFYGKMTARDWLFGVFFTASWFACSYGLGFVCILLTAFALLLLARKFKTLLLITALLLGSWFLLQTKHFNYERENIALVQEHTDVRKLTMFEDFFELVAHDLQIFLIGTGPGGYNSRTTFLLRGENGNLFNRMYGSIEPPYYKQLIYPLWNNTFVSQEDYTDGTRNKPYSDFISLWAEQGVFFLILFIWMYCKQLKKLRPYKNYVVEYHYLIALDLFMIISLISHMWLESSEFLIYCIIRLILLADMQQKRINTQLKLQA